MSKMLRMSPEQYAAHQAKGIGVLLAAKPEGPTKFILPYPPTVNTYWRNVNGRAILSKNAREYRQAVLAACGPRKPLLGRLRVILDIYPPDARRRDLDNLPKGVLDALQHAGVYKDDSQIDELTIRRNVSGNQCHVTIFEA